MLKIHMDTAIYNGLPFFVDFVLGIPAFNLAAWSFAIACFFTSITAYFWYCRDRICLGFYESVIVALSYFAQIMLLSIQALLLYLTYKGYIVEGFLSAIVGTLLGSMVFSFFVRLVYWQNKKQQKYK